ncbi:hypothetical protein ACRRTK_002464 [Alexandromys fortis]
MSVHDSGHHVMSRRQHVLQWQQSMRRCKIGQSAQRKTSLFQRGGEMQFGSCLQVPALTPWMVDYKLRRRKRFPPPRSLLVMVFYHSSADLRLHTETATENNNPSSCGVAEPVPMDTSAKQLHLRLWEDFRIGGRKTPRTRGSGNKL